MAIRTPQKEESAAAARNSVDKEWVTEHARQVVKGGHASLPAQTDLISACIMLMY